MVLISQEERTQRRLLNRTAPVNAGDILLNKCSDKVIWMLLIVLFNID